MENNNSSKYCINPFADPVSYYSQLTNICLYFIASGISVYGFYGRTVNAMLLHRNTRILLINHHIAITVNCISYMVTSIYNVWLLLWHFNDCTYIRTPYSLCAYIRGPGIVCFAMIHLSHMAILLERYVATVHASKYEYLNGNFAISCLVFVVWALGLAYGGNLVYDQNGITISGCLSLATPGNGNRVAIALSAISVNDVLVMILFYLVFKWNQRLRRRLLSSNHTIQCNLSEKYQIDENTRWARVMFYCTCLFCITYSIPVLIGTVIRNVSQLEFLWPWYIALQMTSGVLYAITYPFLLRKAELKIRQNRLVMVTNKIADAGQLEHYFANLKNGWETKIAEKK